MGQFIAVLWVVNGFLSQYKTHIRTIRFIKVGDSSKVACSKRSDTGEGCRVKKAMRSRGGLGREVRERL